MSGEDVDAAVDQAERAHPELGSGVRGAADGLTAGEGAGMIHQAVVQQFLWWTLPRRYPEETWEAVAAGCAALLDELGMSRLAAIARSAQTATILDAWKAEDGNGAAASRAAERASGVSPPDTDVLTWANFFGSDELCARDAVERALGDAIETGALVPGRPRWRATAAAITDGVLTRPLDIPPGQTYAGMVSTERIGTWIDSAADPDLAQWRSTAAKRLLTPIDPPADPAAVVAPLRWLLELAAEDKGAELTQSFYLARTTVLAAVERFGWWDWNQPPRSEAEVHQLMTIREAALRLRLVRRRARRLLITARGSALLADPASLWWTVATATEDDERFTAMTTELMALRLLQGIADLDELEEPMTSLLDAQGWTTDHGPLTARIVGQALWRPLRWWRLFGTLDEVESKWEYGTGRRLNPHTVSLTAAGEAMALAFLRQRAAGPRSSYRGY